MWCSEWWICGLVEDRAIPANARLRSATCNFSINKLETSFPYGHDESDRKLYDYFHSDRLMLLPFPQLFISIGLLAQLHGHVCVSTHFINDDT